jgi:CHAD domain-containing protein
MKKKLWKNSLSLRDNLHRALPVLASEYFTDGRQAMASGTSWHDMHQFRLATKRFRYTLELFRPAYGPGLVRRIDALKKLQTYLGEINDCIIVAGMLNELPGTEELRMSLVEKADAKICKMRSYWLRRLDAPGEERRWMRYLQTYACRRPPVPRTRRIATADLA